MVDEDEGELLAKQGEEGPLLVAAGEGLDGSLRRALDVEGGDARDRPRFGGAAVDEEAAFPFGEDEVLGDAEARDEAFLEPRGWKVGDAFALEVVVGSSRHVALVDADLSRDRSLQASAGGEEDRLPGAFHAGEAYRLARADGKVEIVDPEPEGIEAEVPRREDCGPRLGPPPGNKGHFLAEHQLDEAARIEGGLALAD